MLTLAPRARAQAPPRLAGATLPLVGGLALASSGAVRADRLAPAALIGVGMSFGPSAGQFYAGETWRGFATAGLRLRARFLHTHSMGTPNAYARPDTRPD